MAASAPSLSLLPSILEIVLRPACIVAISGSVSQTPSASARRRWRWCLNMAGCFERACPPAKIASAACCPPTVFESRTSGVDPILRRRQRVKPWTGDSKGTAEFESVTVRFPAVCNCLQISLSAPYLSHAFCHHLLLDEEASTAGLLPSSSRC